MSLRLSILLGFLSFFFILYSQAYFEYDEEINWTYSSTDSEKSAKSFNNIAFNEIDLKSNKLCFLKPLPFFNSSIESFEYEILAQEIISNSKQYKSDLINSYSIEHQVVQQRGKAYLRITVLPIKSQGSQLVLASALRFKFMVVQNNQPLNRFSRSQSFSSSVLNAGQWYKIAIDKDGVYQINKSFLEELGLNVAQLDPRNIQIYGNKGLMLPEANSQSRDRDLIENSIIVAGQEDGSFDDQDYILFYGDGPDEWVYDSSLNFYDHNANLYDRYNYYFLKVGASPGKRIIDAQEVSNHNKTINTFDEFKIHEQEKDNFINSGREFWGEAFEINTSQDFGFNFQNISTQDPVKIYTRTAGRSVVNGMSFKVTNNSQEVASMVIPLTSINYTATYARVSSTIDSFTSLTDSITLNYTFNRSSSADRGWLDFIVLQAKRALKYENEQQVFFSIASVGAGNISLFEINNPSINIKVWDITEPSSVKNLNLIKSASKVSFTSKTDSLKKYIMFDDSQLLRPTIIGKIDNQNYRGTQDVDFIIVSPNEFLAQADQIGQLHKTHDGLNYIVAEQSKIFNEFSGGRQDPTAVRDFVKYLYDKALAQGSSLPKYLLLFGDGSYDPLSHENEDNTNFILTYESQMSVDPVGTYVSDDYFGFLDDQEGANIGANDAGALDIGVGRMPVASQEDANTMVTKVKRYLEGTFGNWKNNITFVADDEDGNIHLDDADELASNIERRYPEMNIDKIYFDAYPQENAAGGERYPDVQKAINNKMFSGSFIVNYTGHGGELGWAHERVLNISDIRSWTNMDKLPLFMTATCEFSRYDDPSRVSAGELVLLSDQGGAIALMTTVRLVYSFANQNLATNFYDVVLEKKSELALGDIVRITKNNALPGVNNRKFTLLGDPALKLSYPKEFVSTISINDKPLLAQPDTILNGQEVIIRENDTLKALSKVKICGMVHDSNGVRHDDFNGTVYTTIFDKALQVQTLENDKESEETTFNLQQNIIYSGKSTVLNGEFCYEFVVPKDIGYKIDYGKISYYADNQLYDASGSYDQVKIGGTSQNIIEDNQGPEMEIFMNDESFVFGGLTNENPILIVKLSDSSGINTVGNSIGHDLSMTLDDDPERINLNNFYAADLDSYQSGALTYPMNNLDDGRHSINVKAWDVHNNSSEGSTEFVVAQSADLALTHVLNYPNPFVSNTTFWFEHNRPGENLAVKIQIFTVSGKLIKTISTSINTEGFLVNDINWDGKDSFGDDIGNGVYVYSIEVQSEDGSSKAVHFDKLVLVK